MFYEKEEIYDLLQVTKTKSNYSHHLITGKFENHHLLSESEFIMLTMRWKRLVKNSLHQDDFGCVLNNGNIFIGIHVDRKSEFLGIVSEISIEKPQKGSVHTELLELTSAETSAIIN